MHKNEYQNCVLKWRECPPLRFNQRDKNRMSEKEEIVGKTGYYLKILPDEDSFEADRLSFSVGCEPVG